MLDWKNLNTKQRLTVLLFSLFLAFTWAIVLFAATESRSFDARSVLGGVAITAFMLATLLNPEAVRGQVGGLNPLAAPKACKWLYALALTSLIARVLPGLVG
ncbi:hypothetical protein [Kinneretia aquatilis]|jgi:hypothetical protein|uniref:hypothetical protein n=1 Tax=Kinneretia aquatilis TaxID=2070761 RepID=UPI0014951194|nr:hypothetical protein [Paucibacter aquatile]WIV97128.1 hypothetical protein K9V56_019255 [Paucibacter aquatile]